MKSITLLAPNFAPESNAGAKRITALAHYLLAKGWRVTVVTQYPHHPQGRIYDGFDAPSPQVSSEGTLTIVRLRPWIVGKENLVLRLLSEAVFAVLSLPYVFRVKSTVIFASSPYMFLGPTGLLLGRLTRAPFIWDVRDLTWLYPRAAGKRTFGVDLVLEAVMRFTARQADLVTTATEGLSGYFDNLPRSATVIHNGVSSELFAALSALPPPKFEATVRPLIAYVGLFGYNHGVANIAAVARLVPEADFVLVGDGPDYHALVEISRHVTNLRIEPYQPFSQLKAIYAAADVLVSHVRRSPIFKWTQPAKIWEYMATGRPVIHAGEGEVVELMAKEDIGATVPPENPEAMAAAIRFMLANPRQSIELGRRGQQYVRFTRLREELFRDLEVTLLGLIRRY